MWKPGAAQPPALGRNPKHRQRIKNSGKQLEAATIDPQQQQKRQQQQQQQQQQQRQQESAVNVDDHDSMQDDKKKLSSKVMNMRFMQRKASTKRQQQQQQHPKEHVQAVPPSNEQADIDKSTRPSLLMSSISSSLPENPMDLARPTTTTIIPHEPTNDHVDRRQDSHAVNQTVDQSGLVTSNLINAIIPQDKTPHWQQQYEKQHLNPTMELPRSDDDHELDHPPTIVPLSIATATPLDMYGMQGSSVLGRRSFGGYNPPIQDAWRKSYQAGMQQKSSCNAISTTRDDDHNDDDDDNEYDMRDGDQSNNRSQSQQRHDRLPTSKKRRFGSNQSTHKKR